MNLQARPYRDPTDLARMRQLLMAGAQAKIPASYMHPGYLDWATHCPPDEQANRRNLRLWESVGEDPPALAGWAIFLSDEGSFDLFVSPALHGTPQHETVMDEYVAWAEERAREAGLNQLWPFWAMEHDTVLERLMKERGFVVVQADPPIPLFERSLDDLPTIPLPDGFSVQGVSDLDDGRLRAAVTHGAFRPNDDLGRLLGRVCTVHRLYSLRWGTRPVCAFTRWPGCVGLHDLVRSGEWRGFVRAGGHPSRFSGQGPGQSGDGRRAAPHEGGRHAAGHRWLRPQQCGRAGVVYFDGISGFVLFCSRAEGTARLPVIPKNETCAIRPTVQQ